MSTEETPPQYIVTTPGDPEDPTTSSSSSSTTSITSANNEQNKVSITSKTYLHTTRSHSLQSSTSTIVEQSSSLSSSTSSGNPPFASLVQQHKAVSSANIIASTEKHYQTKTSSSTTATKAKFQSFLQHPDPQSQSGHATQYVSSAQQKHVRQFVRSTSAHSDTVGGVTGAGAGSGGAGHNRPDKCIRSSSAQIDDGTEQIIEHGSSRSLQQASTILISKSAETIEANRCGGAMRTQLTLSGGLLAPPNRKLTILSPIHAPPGLHDILKRHGRSPLSPRISFPGSDADIFP